MIEISHAQARLLIREELDGRKISREQWAILYAHLENCPACRSYQARISTVEHEVSRAFHHRWSSVNGPSKDTVEDVLSFRKARTARWKAFRSAAWILAVVLAVAAFAIYNQLTSREPATVHLSTPTPIPTSVPPVTHRFRGSFLLSETNSAGSKISLLIPGVNGKFEKSTLVESQGMNDKPSWSPDGEWVAFLSDRSGKSEVYVVHISGTQLTQLTRSPDIQWQSDISWSPDGKWLALLGNSGANFAYSFIYLVPLDGTGAQSIGYSRDSAGPVMFAPAGSLMAFGLPIAMGMKDIQTLNIFDRSQTRFLQTNSQNIDRPVNLAKGLDWSPNGREIALITSDRVLDQDQEAKPKGTLVISRYPKSEDPVSTQSRVLMNIADVSRIKTVSWSPAAKQEVIAYLSDERQQGCWNVTLLPASRTTSTRLAFPDICVDGSLTKTNWTVDGNWLVVTGHRVDEQETHLFALQVPADLAKPGDVYFEALSEGDTPIDMGSFDHEVQVRPIRKLLNIHPIQNKTADAAIFTNEQARAQLADLSGHLVYHSVVDNPAGFTLISPDGKEREMIAEDEKDVDCPTISPDGKQIAYTAPVDSSQESTQNRRNVFLYNIEQKKVVQLTDVLNFKTDKPDDLSLNIRSFDCPVWSTVGDRIAGLASNVLGHPLVYSIDLDQDRKTSLTSILTTFPSSSNQVVWSPDGKYFLVGVPSSSDQPNGKILMIQADDLENPVSDFISDGDWSDILGMAFSPDGSQLAFLSYKIDPSVNSLLQQLHYIDVKSRKETKTVDLRFITSVGCLTIHKMAWLKNGQISFVVYHEIDSKKKTDLYVTNPANSAGFLVFPLDQVALDVAWAPSASWVAFSSESGLFVLDISSRQRDSVTPIFISDDTTINLDWR